ncbi:MAG: hypothetical protein HY718_08980 [Planctomycetes bacterium]|nr:hypothetical protein [Planctomycetota bacterium]
MMKFFRKYTKHLLAVFMVLLLVVWLGGEALRTVFERNRGGADEVVARAFDEEVRTRDLAQISAQSEIGKALIGDWWNAPWVGLVYQMVGGNEQLARLLLMQFQGREEGLSLEEWYLLDTEARRNGVHVPAEAVDDYKAKNLPAEYLNTVRERHKLSIAQLDQAIQAYLRVEQAAMLAADSVVVSEADIQDFIRQSGEKIKVAMVLVDPAKLSDDTHTPTDEELQAQFEQYKDKPARGPGNYGYQLPEATQVEYIEINADDLAQSQTVSEDDAYTYWTAHKNEFTRPVTQPATSTAPATRPETPKAYDTFWEAKAKVKEKLAHDKATRAATRLAEELIRQLAKPWANQPTTQPGHFRQPPASEMAADVYDKVIAGLAGKYGTALRLGRTELLDAGKLMADPRIGRATAFADTPQRVMFSQAAFMVAGLSADPAADPRHARLFRNVFETCGEPLRDWDGNVYIFQNLAVRPAQAPASFSEARETLVADLRSIRAYGEAERIARDLAAKAAGSGLKPAFQGDAALAAKLENALLEPEPFPRKQLSGSYYGMPTLRDASIQSVGPDRQLCELCFNLAERTTATQPSPVEVYEQKARHRWVVVEFEKLLPVTRDEYTEQRDTALRYLQSTRRLDFVLNWFNKSEIMARTGWQDLHAAPANNGDKKSDEKAPAAAEF